MALKVYYSDRIEDLAEDLKRRLIEERCGPGSDPFMFSQVVVPNTNIAKWLQIRAFADSPALCMGVEFPFIEERLFGLLSDSVGDGKRPQLLPMNAYANAIMSILLKDDDEKLAPFRRYIADGDAGPLKIDSRSKARMAWQLAVRLADLMDKYEVHREDVVMGWLDEGLAAGIKSPTEIAEAALARRLFGENGVFPPTGDRLSLRQLFGRAGKVRPCAVGRPIYIFGISTLSSLQVRILHWLAKENDVIVYHNNVCLEYWGDIEMLQRLRSTKDVDADIDIDNGLLCKWGVAGRETLRLLVDLEDVNGSGENPVEFVWEDISRSQDRADATMLEKVQASIRRRTKDIGTVGKQDSSLQVVGAPGIRREVEMVHNAILGVVWKSKENDGLQKGKDGLTFSDIAVLVPDMKTYRPIIESVFDGRGQIPYGLIDTSASEHSRYLLGFMSLMALARDGLSRETAFAVLDNPCVQNALDFTPADVKEWRRYTESIGAFDGFKGDGHRRNFSWNSALARLRLGMVANDRPGLTVWQGGEDSALRFSEIVETLFRELSPLSTKRLRCTAEPVPDGGAPASKRENWADVLRHVARMFLAVGKDTPLEESVKRQLFQTLHDLDMIEGDQSLDFVVEAVAEFVGGIRCQAGGYLTHGVTIAGLQPMRPVPFRQVFVLGMGEGSFPGRDSESTLEIRGVARTLGDMKPSAMKKYLFLETLMATRERLVVSYPNLDIAKDAEMFPSGMVCDLEDFISRHILPGQDGEGSEFKEVKLPLLERGEPGGMGVDGAEDPVVEVVRGRTGNEGEYFAGIIPTYSNVERGIARKMAAAGKSEGIGPSRDGGAKGELGRPAAVTAKELAEFLESPLKAVLHRRYGIVKEGHRDDALDPDSPMEMTSGPVKWEFQRAVLDAIPDDSAGALDVAVVYRRFADRGLLPDADDVLGRYSLEKIKAELAGDASSIAEWRNLKDFAERFSPESGTRPDPVRTFFDACYKKGAVARGERLYTGQTAGWVQTDEGATSCALVFNKCGDERKRGNVELATFPPKAVLEPLVTWLMMVAGMEGERERSLCVGIADIDEMLCNEWNWTATPKTARDRLNGLTDAYLSFLSVPDDDGRYLDCGYSDVAKAIDLAKKQRRVAEKFPSDGEWEAVVEIMDVQAAAADFASGNSGFNDNLVIGRTMEEWSRKPDGGRPEDVAEIRKRFENLYKLPLDGKRSPKAAEA